MISKELIDFLNNISGEELDETLIDMASSKISKTAKITKGVVSELKGVIASDKYVSKGANKTCTFLGDKKVLACLKQKTPVKSASVESGKKLESKIRKLNNKVVSKGALVPKIYALFFADKKYIEIQQRIKGSPIAIFNFENFTETIIDEPLDPIIFNCSEEERLLIGEKLFNYNLGQQQNMINAPQDCYDKLYKTIEILSNHGIEFLDSHSENVLLGEKGFSLIDIDYESAIENREKGNTVKPNNNNNIFNFLNPFSYASSYDKFLTKEQVKILESNNVEILKKLVDAISNNNVIGQFNLYRIKQTVLSMLDEESLNKYADYIFASQTELRTKHNFKPDEFLCEVKAGKVKKR